MAGVLSRLWVGLSLLTVAEALSGQSGPAGIWLVDLGPRSARLAVWSEQPPPELMVGIRGGPLSAAPLIGPGPVWTAHLDGLSPGTVTEARCGWRHLEFLVPEAEPRSVRVGILGHIGGTRGWSHHPPEAAIARVDDLRTDLVIHGGDAVYVCNPEGFHRDVYQRFDRLFQRSPVFLVPGNHEAGWPDPGVDYSVFRRCLPYSFALAAPEPPCWEVRRGPVRFLFVSYFGGGLEVGTAQRRWLESALVAETDAQFTVLVGGFAKGTFPNGDALLASLPRERLDLIVGGDGEGAWHDTLDGTPRVFIGSGGTQPHPYGLLEVRDHILSLNAYDLTGAALFDLFLLDRRRREGADLRGGFVTGGRLVRCTVTEEGQDLLLRPSEPGAITWMAPPPPEFRGVQLDLTLEPKDGRPGVQDVYLMWMHGDPLKGPSHRSQPFRLRFGERARLTLTLPPTEPLTGAPWQIPFLGLRIYEPSPALDRIRLHRAVAF